MSADDVYGFSQPVANLIYQRVVGETTVESEPTSQAVRGIWTVLTPSGGIAARSGTTCGYADCTVYHINDSGVLVATSNVVRVYNTMPGAVAGSKYCDVGMGLDGKYRVLVEPCG